MSQAPENPTNIHYVYDGFGRRVGETWTTNSIPHSRFYVFDGDLLIGEVTDGVVSRVFNWGANGLISKRELNTQANSWSSVWYHFGAQGETRQVTNSSGAVVGNYSYDAYGRGNVDSQAMPFGYGGQVGYYTSGNGLILCGARWYDANQGRWLTRDPIGYSGGLNLYEYCGNNPVMGIDPSGLCDVWGFTKGFGSAFNPIGIVRNGFNLGAHINASMNAGRSLGEIGSELGRGLLNGVNPFGKDAWGTGNALGNLGLLGLSAKLGRMSGATEQVPFANLMDAAEAVRYEKYWQNYAPSQVAPGTTRLNWDRISGRTGQYENSTVIYDQFGRQSYRVDWTNHMRADHSNPHLHELKYNYKTHRGGYIENRFHFFPH